MKVISVCHDKTHAATLIYSLEKNGWDYEIIETEWKGFGTKLISVYNYLKEHYEVDYFIFVDAFDVICLGKPDEFVSKMHRMNAMMMGMERGLWPPILQPFKDHYNTSESGFDFVNSGMYYAPSKLFIEIFEKYKPFYEIDDQFWLNMVWLMGEDFDYYGDGEQKIFNNYSFIKEGEYTYNNNRVQINGNEPIFIHGNGRSDMTKILELI